MGIPKHVRIVKGGRPFDWELDDWMTDGPGSAVGGDDAPAVWGALNAIGFCTALVLFAVGLGLAATAPAGRADIGMAGVALVIAGCMLAAVAWGCAHEEQGHRR